MVSGINSGCRVFFMTSVVMPDVVMLNVKARYVVLSLGISYKFEDKKVCDGYTVAKIALSWRLLKMQNIFLFFNKH